jgi:ATP diphosphatase
MQKLLEIMAQLRDPQNGCSWDLEQDFRSIAPYTIEEAYEVADAIDRADLADLKEELGDLLLQVVFHAQMASEQNAFDFSEVVASISEKMVRRHPHVFGDEPVADVQAQHEAWETHKARERDAVAGQSKVLDGISLNLPALSRANKLGKRAARVGFDWPDADGAMVKIHEELTELADARARDDLESMAEELGDLLFSVVNLARHLSLDAEESLRSANRKFIRRFEQVEALVMTDGRQWSDYSADQLEAFWERAKTGDSL